MSESHEANWQELVVRHLGLRDWVRLDLSNELDILGPLATASIKKHGLLYPFNSHFHIPPLAAAAGGSLMTGIGGDELFEPTERAVLAHVFVRRQGLKRRYLKPLASSVKPRWWRVRELRQAIGAEDFPWIRPATRDAIRRRNATWLAAEPVSYARALTKWWWPSRYVQYNLATKRLLAQDHDVEIFHPFMDPEVMAAYGAELGAVGPLSRRWALSELVGDLLPAELITRDTKSSFNGAFWNGAGRAFAEAWTGQGVDPDVVDPVELRKEWLSESPDPHSYLLLQQAYLALSTENEPVAAVTET